MQIIEMANTMPRKIVTAVAVAPPPSVPSAPGLKKTIEKKKGGRKPNPKSAPMYDKLIYYNTATVQEIFYGGNLNLSEIYEHTHDSANEDFCVYLPKRGLTAMVIIKHLPTKTTGKIYREGTFTTNGAVSTKDAREGNRAILDFIKKEVPYISLDNSGYESDFDDDELDPLKITQMHARVRVPFHINLDAIASTLHFSSYEPELNALLKLRKVANTSITAMISVNGKVNLTATGRAATEANIKKAWDEFLRPLLEQFRKAA